MGMHKADKNMEAGLPPNPELIAKMGPLVEEMMKAGVMESTEGLLPSSAGVRLSFRDGKRTFAKGPFQGVNDIISCYTLVRLRSLDEAVEWATRLAEAAGALDVDVRPLCEPWDMGMCPKPEDAPLRFMITRKADAVTESGPPRPSPAVRKIQEEMTYPGQIKITVIQETRAISYAK